MTDIPVVYLCIGAEESDGAKSGRTAQAGAVARANGQPTYTSLQHHYTYLQPRLQGRESPENTNGAAHLHVHPQVTEELLDYVRHEDDLTL